MGLEDKIIPIHAKAHDLPFAHEFFDVAISVDAYHYFGVEEDYLTKYFAPLVKKRKANSSCCSRLEAGVYKRSSRRIITILV